MSIVGLDSYVAHTSLVLEVVRPLKVETYYHGYCNERRSSLVPFCFCSVVNILLGEGLSASAIEGAGMTEVSCLPRRCIVTGPELSW